jgi:hypothetical protein
MRVLMVSLIGARSNLASESCFSQFRGLWRKGREVFPRFFVHLAVPEKIAAGTAAVLTDDEKTYIEIIPERIPFSFRVQECTFDPVLIERFNRYLGTSWVDLVLSARVTVGQQLQLALRDWRGPGGMPGVALWEPGLDQDFLVSQGDHVTPYRLAKAVSLASCPSQLLGADEYRLAASWTRRYLSPTLVDQFASHATVLLPRAPSIARDPTASPAVHTLFYGGRMNEVVKRTSWLVQFYANVFALGYPVQIVLTSPSTIKPKIGAWIAAQGRRLNGEPLIVAVPRCGREAFMDAASKASMCVVPSTYEAFPYGFLQQASSALLTLFPDKPWARAMLPPDYPWFYKNDVEALALIRRALQGEWVAMVRAQLGSLRRHQATGPTDYDAERWKLYAAAIPPLRKSARPHTPVVQMLARLSAERDRFTLADACLYVQERSRAITSKSWDEPPAAFWSRSWLHHVLLKFGLEDACDGPAVTYVRTAAWPTAVMTQAIEAAAPHPVTRRTRRMPAVGTEGPVEADLV